MSNIFVYFIPKMHVYGSQYSTALEEWGPSMLFSKNSSVPPTLYILAAMTGFFCVILIITSSCFKKLRQIHQCNLGSVRSVSPQTTFHGVAISRPFLSSSSFHTWRHSSFGGFGFHSELFWCLSKITYHVGCQTSSFFVLKTMWRLQI